MGIMFKILNATVLLLLLGFYDHCSATTTTAIYYYDTVAHLSIDGNIKLEERNQRYDRTSRLKKYCSDHFPAIPQTLKPSDGSFLVLLCDFIVAKGTLQLSRPARHLNSAENIQGIVAGNIKKLKDVRLKKARH